MLDHFVLKDEDTDVRIYQGDKLIYDVSLSSNGGDELTNDSFEKIYNFAKEGILKENYPFNETGNELIKLNDSPTIYLAKIIIIELCRIHLIDLEKPNAAWNTSFYNINRILNNQKIENLKPDTMNETIRLLIEQYTLLIDSYIKEYPFSPIFDNRDENGINENRSILLKYLNSAIITKKKKMRINDARILEACLFKNETENYEEVRLTN